ncbi:DUF4302 domain-containing protein [Myroides indicus]|nr:DUF4302 domain-containing protein [Myroides indicus]
MIKRIIKISLCVFVLTALLSSCKSDNEVFTQSPVEREEARQKELREVLTSSAEGWKLEYFTNDSGIGGFSFLMKFTDDGRVTMISDFNDEGYTETEGEYEIQLRATTSLVFTTRNKIHELSDPMNSALVAGRGFEGEYQFRYYGHTEDEILFRSTKKPDNEIRFVRASNEDWSGFENRKAVVEGLANPDAPIFRSVEVSNGSDIKKYDAIFTSSLRFMSFNDGTDQDLLAGKKGFGIGYTNDGAIISPAIMIDDVEYTEFKWNSTNKELVSVNEGNTVVKIKLVDSPSKWSSEYKDYFFSNKQERLIFQREYLLRAPSNTEKFYNLMEPTSVEQFDIYGQNGMVRVVYFTEEGGQYAYQTPVTDGGNKVVIGNGSWQNESSVPDNIKQLHQGLFEEGEFLVKDQKYNIYYINKIVTVYCGGVVFDTWLF